MVDKEKIQAFETRLTSILLTLKAIQEEADKLRDEILKTAAKCYNFDDELELQSAASYLTHVTTALQYVLNDVNFVIYSLAERFKVKIPREAKKIMPLEEKKKPKVEKKKVEKKREEKKVVEKKTPAPAKTTQKTPRETKEKATVKKKKAEAVKK